MPVSNELVATLRAQLVGNMDEHRRLLRSLDQEDVGNNYTALVTAAFFHAVERRFGDRGTTYGDVVEWVGQLRADAPSAADDIDPSVSERLIQFTLGANVPVEDIDPRTKLATQIVLLGAIVLELDLDEAELDELLAKARAVADEWTS